MASQIIGSGVDAGSGGDGAPQEHIVLAQFVGEPQPGYSEININFSGGLGEGDEIDTDATPASFFTATDSNGTQSAISIEAIIDHVYTLTFATPFIGATTWSIPDPSLCVFISGATLGSPTSGDVLPHAPPANPLPSSITINVNFNGVPRDFVFDVETAGVFTMSEVSGWQASSSYAVDEGEFGISDGGGNNLFFFVHLDAITPAVVYDGIDGGSGDFAPVTDDDIVISWVWT